MTALVTFALAANVTAPAFAQSPSPTSSSSAGPAPSIAPSAVPTARLAIVSCNGATFFAWPDRHVAPQPTHYPPARAGDAFHVIGTGTIAPGETNITETTIDVFEPYGAGKHYWILTACVT